MCFELVLQSGHGNLQQFVLPFDLDYLFSHEAFVGFEPVPLKAQVLDFGHQVLLNPHLLDRIVQLVLQLVFETPDYFCFDGGRFVPFVEFVDQVPEFLLLLPNVDLIALQVVLLVALDHALQLLVKAFQRLVELAIQILDFLAHVDLFRVVSESAQFPSEGRASEVGSCHFVSKFKLSTGIV